MPVGWQPVTTRLEELIAEEQAKIDAIKSKWQPEPLPIESVTPVETETTWQLPQYAPPELPTTYTPPKMPTDEQVQQLTTQMGIKKEPAAIIGIPEPTIAQTTAETPFWQRALQIFSAPFEWVDENIIKPGEALAGTMVGAVPEVERKPGEDFWEWKKRSWAGWKSPGIDVNVPWSDKPWRIDMKGVMELSPWLLIPGAGQVGGGVRGAAGIAGILSKVGRVGRILGTAVEYSPWGLVEKSAGVAIKGGIRAVGKVSENVSTQVGEKLFGKYVPPPVSPAVADLTRLMKETVIPAREAFEKVLPKELRTRQEAAVRAAQKEYLNGKITVEELRTAESTALKEIGALRPKYAITKEALKARQDEAIAEIENRIANGELTEASGKVLITKARKSPAFGVTPFEKEKVDELLRMITEASEYGLLARDSRNALNDLLLGVADNLPEPHILKEWGNVFGIEFAKVVKRFTSPQQANNFMDALQIGKSLVSSADLSGTFRQGLFFNLLHPSLVPKWFGRQVKALLSEKLTFDMDDALRAKPSFRKWQNRGAYFAPQRGITAGLAEEAFPSRLAERIPGVKRSQRAFNTYLNEARLDTLELAEAAMVSQGAMETELKLFAEFVNKISGRGSLPKALDKYAPALNAVLFSPKLQLATLQLPRQIGRMLLSNNPYMRREAAKALITFVGGGSAILGLLKVTGNKVEIDPRSGDFGKILIGETRLDIWRGYVQYARFAAQLLSGERKSAYGNMNKAERGEIVGRFLQSKTSPAFGLLVDILRGETYEGKPIFNDTTGFSRMAKERVLPLALQDIIDAMEQSGINGVWVAAPATLGIGVLTYVNDFVRVKERIAQEMGYDSWDDIDPKTQREIQNRNAELQTATIAFDRQMMGTAWGDYKLAGNAIEDVFRQNVDNAVAEYQQTKDGVTFNDKVSKAFTARRGGYDARDKEERFADIIKRLTTEDTSEALVNLGPEQMAIKMYNDALFSDDMYDAFDNYRFDEANLRKEQLKRSLGEEMFNYIEDYRELKFETFPDEFQELMRDRETMRPYWAITDTVVRLFGQRYADSPAGQSLISKRRKQMRLTNRIIAEAYNRFYKQS